MEGQEENYTPLIIAGLVVTIFLFAGLVFYTLQESTRLAQAAESFTEERIERGSENSMLTNVQPVTATKAKVAPDRR